MSMPRSGAILREKRDRQVFHPARKFFGNRIRLADDLRRRYAGSEIGTDLDAQVILCAALGAASDLLWPKVRSDRAKFVELLVRYSHAGPSVKTISIPTLMKKLPQHQALRSLDPSVLDSQVLFADEIDRPEQDVLKACPHLDLKDIRSASYANFIYKYMRCGLLHSYTLQGFLTSDDWASSQMHYSWHETPPSEAKRLLFLPYQYVREVTLSVVNCLCYEWENADKWETSIKAPGAWWING